MVGTASEGSSLLLEDKNTHTHNTHTQAAIAPIAILNNLAEDMIMDKANIPTNFTKLGQHIMISKGSRVFNRNEKGSNDVYARFRLKSQVKTEEIINCISFEFSCLGGKNLYKKQHQAMETETPLMLLFVCNRMDQASIVSDTKQMLDTSWMISSKI